MTSNRPAAQAPAAAQIGAAQAVPEELPAYLTVAQLAAHWQVGKSTVYRLTDSGVLRSVRVGSAVRIPRAAVEEYLARRMEKPPGDAGGRSEGAAESRPRASRSRGGRPLDWREVLGLA